MVEFCLRALAIAVVAYFCGCFNGAVIVSKYILRDDVRAHGSGNAGLTNFHRTFGGKLTAVVLLLDVVKMVVAVFVGVWVATGLSAAGQVLGPDIRAATHAMTSAYTGAEENSVLGLLTLMGGPDFSACFDYTVLAKYWAGTWCLMGHMFPCTFGFKGGKGILSGGTLAFLIDWRMGLIAIGLFILMVALTKKVSLGSICATASFPVSSAIFVSREPVIIALSVLLAVLVIWMHRSNIKRLMAGDESQLSLHKEEK